MQFNRNLNFKDMSLYKNLLVFIQILIAAMYAIIDKLPAGSSDEKECISRAKAHLKCAGKRLDKYDEYRDNIDRDIG